MQAPPDEIAAWAKKLPDEPKKRLKYAALVDSVDRSVTRVRQALESNGCADRTLLIFTSDNGGLHSYTDNGPLRGGKGMLFEGGVRVPFIAWGHGTASPSRVIDAPIQLTDLVPTMLEMSGVTADPSIPLVGESLVGVLDGKSSLPDRSLIWHFPAYLEGRSQLFKNWRTTPAASIVRGDWKLIEFFEDGELELYNLKNDLGEKNNLAAKQPEKVKELHAAMLKWRKETKAPVPSEKNPDYDPKAVLKPRGRN